MNKMFCELRSEIPEKIIKNDEDIIIGNNFSSESLKMGEENLILQNGMSESLKADFQNMNYEKRKELFKEFLANDQEFGDGDPCLYLEGDLVWVNVKGSPLWPAMITIPQNETFYTKFRLKKSTKEPVGPRQYHVQFFCDNYRTMWVSSKTIFVYEGLENLRSYCENLKLYIKSCKNTNHFAERNLLKAFSNLRSRTISSNNSNSLKWNQAVLEADQIQPLERCKRMVKFEEPPVNEIKEKDLYKNSVVEANFDAKSSISSLMSSINLESPTPSPSVYKGKRKSLSSTCDSSEEFSGFKEDYSIERKKPKGRKSLKRLKKRGEEDLLDSDLDIKHEIEIKKEPLELCDEYLCHENESVMQKNQRNFGAKRREITNEPKEIMEIFDSPSPSSSRLRNRKRNIIEQKNEERKKIKNFELGKGFQLHAKFESSLCEYKTNLKEKLKSHSLVPSTINLFKCFECNYECNHKSSLELHLLSHSNNKLFKCSECDYMCNHKGNLKRHLLSHSNTKLFKCFKCDYECNQKSHLKRHLSSHSNTKLCKCSKCDYVCNQKSNLKRHLLIHSNTKLFKCSECDYECNQKRYLKSHLLTHSNTKLFKCSECDYECNSKGNLKIHLLSHSNTKLFKCSECDYECNHKGSLNRHLLSHSKTKLLKCLECDYKCNRKGHLKIHLLTHSNTKLFKCSECDYKCNQKFHLKIHLLTHSKNTKLFKCSECDYKCNQKGRLKIHLLTHSNKKLFKCSKCDYKCNQKFHLKRHFLSHSKSIKI